MSKKSLKAFVLVSVLIFSIMLSGCNSKEEGGENGNALTRESDVESMVITTPFGDLFYPEQWSEFVETDQNQSEESISVKFAAKFDEKKFDLFEITIGKEVGSKIGELTDKQSEKREVYMTLNKIPEESELSGDEKNRLFAMQEDVNYLIDKLE